MAPGKLAAVDERPEGIDERRPPESDWLLRRVALPHDAQVSIEDLELLAGMMGLDLAGLEEWLEGRLDDRLPHRHMSRIWADLETLRKRRR